jgi:hypothetical protein
LFLSSLVQAQEIRGRVIASKQYTPVNDVLVANKRTGDAVYSDSTGHFTIIALEGDILYFYRIGFQPHNQQVHLENGKMTTVVLKMSDMTLDEVQVKANTYQQDSAERAITYRKTINDANQKVKMRMGLGAATGGIGFEGLIGKAASKITGREKRIQRFKRMFLKGEQDKFIASRYTIYRVNQLTGLEGEAAIIFIDTYPMEYAFARAASELELNMWIWNNYKQYRNKPKDKQ